MSETASRRAFLQTAGVGAVGALGLSGCARPLSEQERAARPTTPREAPWWTQPGPGPGHHTLQPLPYGVDQLVIRDREQPKIRGISAQVVEWHHGKHHAGYVKALNEIEVALAQAPQLQATANYSPISELKRRETFNASGMYLHDLYWLNMIPGGAPLTEGMDLLTKLRLDFGSFERWREDFVATANTPNTGWAILALAPYDLTLHNFACSFHDLGGVWGAIPLVALDVWEHAYYYDYGPDRASYIESFLRLLNWGQANESFRRWAASGVLR